MKLKGKKIIIGITASIAAYKVPFIIRLLKKAGAEVQVILTPAAHDFVTPLTLSALSERPVLTEFFNSKDGSWSSHIDLGIWADMMLIAPVSANTMAKMATGIADNLLLTTVLSARCPVFFAPAMDLDMFKHQTTINNISILESFGYTQIKPATGELASGLSGEGRMEEPENIVKIITDFLTSSSLSGRKVLITAGPTYENIDPVRFIGNYSSGKMGFELARVFSENGASVELISGPTHLADISDCNITTTHVSSAAEMYNVCIAKYKDSDIAVMSAAVADFTPSKASDRKIKKEDGLEVIELESTKDILAELGSLKQNDQILVGFALETDQEEVNANKKLNNKNLDMIVLNSLKDEGAGFGHDTNKVTILKKDGEKFVSDLKSKYDIAKDIVNQIIMISKKVSYA